MTQFDDIIHQQHRLRIMAALDVDRGPLDFVTLKSISGATDGNLGAHLQTLEKVGYISVAKEVVGRRRRTWVSLSPTGRRAYRGHVAYLENILNFGGSHRSG